MFSLIRGCFVFIVGICSVKTGAEADGYSGMVKALFEDLTEYKSQVAIAKEKMNEFRNETWDRKYAIALMNLYTQPGAFYLTLDAEMKHGYPASTHVWRQAGELMNRGIDILGPKSFDQLYRGCQTFDYLPVRGKVYTFHYITTTSQVKETAVKFVDCANKFVFQIDKAYGVSIEKYSHYPQHKEVILKSFHNFNVDDGPRRDGEYGIYFMSGQASESLSDGNKKDPILAVYIYAALIIIAISNLLVYAILIYQYVTRTRRGSRSKSV